MQTLDTDISRMGNTKVIDVKEMDRSERQRRITNGKVSYSFSFVIFQTYQCVFKFVCIDFNF